MFVHECIYFCKSNAFVICYWSLEKCFNELCLCHIERDAKKWLSTISWSSVFIFWIWHRQYYYLLANCCLFRSKALSTVTGVEKWLFLYLQLYASQGANMVNALGQTSVSATQDTLGKLAIKVRKNLFLKSWKYCYLSPHPHQCCVFPLCL